jgi:hypothetical protein
MFNKDEVQRFSGFWLLVLLLSVGIILIGALAI